MDGYLATPFFRNPNMREGANSLLTKNSSLAINMFSQISQHYKNLNQRCVVAIMGDRSWCYRRVEEVLHSVPQARQLWITDKTFEKRRTLKGSDCRQLLGKEAGLVVFDTYAGIDPDALGIVSGLIKGGGFLLIIAPPWDEWRQLGDLDYQRLCIYPTQIEQLSRRFLQRMIHLLAGNESLIKITQAAEETPLISLPQSVETGIHSIGMVENEKKSARDDGESETLPDQQEAIEKIKRVATGHRRRPLVLTAGRGRGKSAAMGIAAGELIKQGKRRIVVTAPRPDAVASVFKHASQVLNVTVRKNCLCYGEARLWFVPPDQLLREPCELELLLVDEAAGIPTKLLASLTSAYSRIVFATTTDGYEGSGRGFSLRFQKKLAELAPQWQHFEMHTPIRWSTPDPLEKLANEVLLLDTSNATQLSSENVAAGEVHICKVDRDELLHNEPLLRQTYGLLVAAHYRTTPSDLRDLLDGPNLHIYLMLFHGEVVGACLVAIEGGFDEEMTAAIVAGQRRPRGHLLPQALLFHYGLKQAGGLQGARIVRIAIHPERQRQGYGRRLLNTVREHEAENGVDYIGSSFGASSDLLHYWHVLGFVPVRLGFQRETSSGMHSALVMHAITPESHTLQEQLVAAFWQQFPWMIAEHFRDLETDIVQTFYQFAPADTQFSLKSQELAMLTYFADRKRPYDVCSVPIWKMSQCLLRDRCKTALLSETMVAVLVMRVMQKLQWSDIAGQLKLPGRKAICELIRKATVIWLAE